MNDNVNPRVIVALDYPSEHEARTFVDKVSPQLCKLKVGKELFTRCGPGFVRTLVDSGFDVFLDLKFHDIPNTVARACKAAADLGVWMMNVHAQGGRKMLQSASEALESYQTNRPKLLAVTLLTSLGQDDLVELGVTDTPEQYVQKLARMAQQCGVDGIVCSAQEAKQMRQRFGPGFLLVTPGIRPAESALGDQQRVMTPVQAMLAGSSYLVIGRPVTQARDPHQVLTDIDQEIRALT